MDPTWLKASLEDIWGVLLSAVGIYAAVILFTRVAGLRSFAKMSSFDFAMTVAIGSLIATTVTTKNPPLLQSVIALAALYGLQMTVARFRFNGILKGVVDNQPLLLMSGTRMLEDNLRKTGITHADIFKKMREANITQLSQVKAVIMETTGDISVLHHNDLNHKIDNELLHNVLGADAERKTPIQEQPTNTNLDR